MHTGYPENEESNLFRLLSSTIIFHHGLNLSVFHWQSTEHGSLSDKAKSTVLGFQGTYFQGVRKFEPDQWTKNGAF